MIYEEIDTWEKIVKVDLSEIKRIPEHVCRVIANPGYLSKRSQGRRGQHMVD